MMMMMMYNDLMST